MALLFSCAAASTAAADLTASYDGMLTGKKLAGLTVAGVLTQTSTAVVGTMAFSGGDPQYAGIYQVSGSLKGSKLTLLGASGGGVALKWTAKVAGDTGLAGKATLRGAGRGKGVLALTRRVETPPANPPSHCDNSFFTTDVMQGVLVPICAACHVAGGAAQTTSFRVTSNDVLATQDSVALQIDLNDWQHSRLLLKPLNELPHGGGAQLAAGSDAANTLAKWAELVATNHQCDAPTNQQPTSPLAPAELLVRASMDLRGTRPAPADLDGMEADPNAYATLVDQYLHSDAFLERVKDVFDDALLVRREDFDDEARDETYALYDEALELIAYIVKNDRPFTEIGTADYTVANQLFQQNTDRNPFPMEPVSGPEWQPTHYTDGRPHAGLLSTSAFYKVWDTNNTNVNRRRANRWSIVFHCYNFLDTPVDVTRNVDNNDPNAVLNAVTTRADCKACHERLDPLASFLFPMDNAGFDGDVGPNDFFRGNPERWRRVNRRAPAVYGRPGTDIRDMGRLMVENEKFDQCQTKRAFRLLTGRYPQSSLELQTADAIATAWGDQDGHNYRALVKRWMLSDAYKTRPDTDNAAWVRRASPERLESLFTDVTGFTWTRSPDNDEDDSNPGSRPNRTAPVPLLTTEENAFKIILGGINGTSVSARSTDLNASVAIVQRKLATLATEDLLKRDLALPDDQRKLLHGVTGMETPDADEATVRAIVVALARRLYGQHYAPDSPETDVWFDLFRALYNDRSQSGTGQNQVPGTQSERAWRGLVVAMLRSPRMVLY